jgi:hypothetical protein
MSHSRLRRSINMPFYHPRVGGSYVANLSAPSFHPDVHANLTAALAGIMPSRHPNVTTLIFNVTRTRLPGDHPPIDPWLGILPRPSYTPFRCASKRMQPACDSSCALQSDAAVLAPLDGLLVPRGHRGAVLPPGRARQPDT